MKNILLLISFMLFAGMSYSQIKVETDGDTKIGNTGVSPAAGAKLHVDGGNLVVPNARIGIGTDSPTRSLHIKDALGTMQLERDQPSPGFLVSRATTGFASTLKTYGFLVDATTTTDGFFTISDFGSALGGFSTRRLTIDADGGLIVGTSGTSTPYTLHVGAANGSNGSAFKGDGNGLWTVVSDKRTKTNVKKYTKGLEIINQLEPIEYKYNGKAGTSKGQYQVSVMAQDLQKIAPFMVSEFVHQESDGVMIEGKGPTKIKEEKFLSINTSALQFILVNAVKEQQAMIDEKDEEISELYGLMQELRTEMNELKNTIAKDVTNSEISINNKGEALLLQNRPNPTTVETTIDYNIPADSNNAKIVIYDITGKVIRTVAVDHSGEGALKVNTQNITSGTYSYQLIVDDKTISTKKMVVQK